jgi:hypothetical protein
MISYRCKEVEEEHRGGAYDLLNYNILLDTEYVMLQLRRQRGAWYAYKGSRWFGGKVSVGS